MFDYQNIELECRNLLSGWDTEKADYDFPNPAATFYFQVINVGNDERVLKALLERERFLYKNNFQKIIALRDMYGRKYKDKSNTIDANINQRFLEETRATIQEKAINPDVISFFYAIMEVEAWFLALPSLLTLIDTRLTNTFILSKLGFDLEIIDPEVTFFHPAKTLNDIFELVGKSYDKKSSTINEIARKYTKDDYILLSMSEKCNSFQLFYECIFDKKY